MKTTFKALVLTLLLAGAVSAQVVTGGGSGGGITQVSSLTGLACTVGGTNANVNLTVASPGFPAGQYNCTITGTPGTFGFVGTNAGHTLNASDFGVTAAGNEVCDATSVNTSQHLTTTANDPAFTAAMIGWSIWGSNTCIDGVSYTNQVPIGTITAFNSAHDVSTSVSGASITSNAVTLHLKWGPVEDTQLTAAENSAWNYAVNTNNGACYQLILSGGFTVVKQPHFNTVNCSARSTGTASTGASVVSFGRMSSRLMITPDFNFAACPSYNGRNTCFGGVNGFSKQNWGISGGQEPGTNPAAATCIMQDGIDSQTINMFLVGFGSALANLRAYCTVTAVGASGAIELTEDGMGAIGWEIGTGQQACGPYCFFGSNNLANIETLNAGGELSTYQMYFGAVGGTGVNVFFNGGGGGTIWHSFQDTWQVEGTGAVGVETSGADQIWIDQATSTAAAANFLMFYSPAGSAHFYVSNSILNAGTANYLWYAVGSTGIFDDMGGNVFTTPQVPSIALGTTPSAFRTIVNSSTFSVAPAAGLTNCASTAGTCRSWFTGSVGITNPATTVTVSTTAVGANSQIIIFEDATLGTKLGATCNATAGRTYMVTTRTGGTSFIITASATPAANTACLNYAILN